MQVFKLVGSWTDDDADDGAGSDAWEDYNVVYLTRERAERQKASIIAAYTYEGVCDLTLEIVPLEVKE